MQKSCAQMPMDVPVQLEAKAYPNPRYINREEDDGNTGLHRAKRSRSSAFSETKIFRPIH